MRQHAAGNEELQDSGKGASADVGAGNAHPVRVDTPRLVAAIAPKEYVPVPPPLTAKQSAFVDAYMLAGNATQAYRRAYDVDDATMLAKTTKDNASVLLRHTGVAAAIASRRAEAEDAVLAALVAAKIAAPQAVDRIVAIASLDPEEHKLQLAPILRANEAVAGIAGIMPRGGGVTVNVGGDHRRIDERAIELWNARKQREHDARATTGDE